MATTGDIASAVTGVLTHSYTMKEMEEVFAHKNIFYNLISSNVKAIGGERATNPDGGSDYLLLKRYVLNRQHIIGARQEGQDVRLPGTSTRTYGTLYPKQLVGSTGWTREELLFCRNEPQFEDIVRAKWTGENGYVAAHRHIRDILWQGDGTGRLARVSAYTATAATYGTVTVDNTQANFGWTAGDLLFDGMTVSIYTVADIAGTSAWAVKATECVVSDIVRRASSTTSTFVITARTDSAGNAIAGSEIAAVPANSDYVFIAGAPVLTSANKFSSWGVEMGIHGIVDDGQDAGYEFTESGNLYNHSWYGATIQGINRSTTANRMYRATVSRGGDRNSGTDGTAQTTDMNDIDEVLDVLFQTNTAANPEKLIGLCNIKTNRWWQVTARNEQNGWQDVTDGTVVPGMSRISGFRSAAANKVIPVFTIPTMADGTIIFLDTSRLARWELVPFGPVPYMGKTQFESPGTRNMTFEQWGESFGNLGFERCDTSLRIEDISIA